MNNSKNRIKKTSKQKHNKKQNVCKVNDDNDADTSSTQDDLIAKIRDELNTERNEKEKYKLNLKKIYYEKQEVLNLLKKCQTERDTFRQDLDSLKQIHMKELRRSKAEIDALTKEYCQIMSERDNVHKEIEALQEKLNKSQDKVKQMNRTSSFINNSELNTTRMSNLNTTILDDLQMDTLKRQLKIVMRQRDEAYLQIDELNRKNGIINDTKQRNSLISESNHVFDDDDANDEYSFKKKINTLIKELDLCKKRRDIAFIERDKILRERESIRALCDELRHQRDKSISELAESLRENDDLKKDKSMAIKQIQMLENKLSYYEDKLISYREQELKKEECENKKRPDGHTNLSKSLEILSKSASRATKSDDNFRIIKIEINLDDNPELGVEFSYATYEFDNDDEQNEFRMKNKSNNLIIVNSVDPDSISYGKLKEHDHILKINEIDLRDIELDDLEQVIKNLSGTVEFIVSRHFPKGLSNELESVNSNEDVDFSTLPSMSSMTSSFISNSFKETKKNLIRSKKSRSSDKTDTNSIDYVSYVTNKQNKNILIELNNLNDLKLENGIFIIGFDSDKTSDYEFKNVSIGDRVVSINGHGMKNKTLVDMFKYLNDRKQGDKVKLLIEKTSNVSISPSSSMLSLNLDLNNLKFKSNSSKPNDDEFESSNSLTSSVVIESKKDKLVPIRPLYYDKEFSKQQERPESRLFDKIVNGSVRYEDLINNLQSETSRELELDGLDEPELINKIYL